MFYMNKIETFQDMARKATGMQIDALEDGYIDHGCFLCLPSRSVV